MDFVEPFFGTNSSCQLKMLHKIAQIQLFTRLFHLSIAKAYKKVPLTADSYPLIKRRPEFKSLTAEDLKVFGSIVGHDHVLTSSDDVDTFNTDWTRKYRGQSTCVVRPKNAQEISKILAYCNDKAIAVVPQAGKTGLVGGSVPVFDEIVLSVSRLDQINSFDEGSGILTCGAGCILENLDRFLLEKGYLMPLGNFLIIF